MKKKLGFFVFAALLAGAALALGLSACSSGGDDNAALMAALLASKDQTQDTPPAPPAPASYTITFNANDGSQSPATATQTFTAGTPQNLKTVAELGFSKSGFNFAGWGTTAGASESSYADGASYTASADTTLYALWSAIPVYSVNIPVNEHGTVTASPATAIAGTEITLSNTPNEGYQFASYAVTDADGTAVSVTDGKFTMPAKNVTVTVTFNAINYNINVGTFANGSVTANPAPAIVGTSVTLTISPASGYELATLTVTDSDGTSVAVSGTGDSRTFTMPAKDVTVTATFNAINYNINVGPFENGSVTANPTTATIGTSVTLTISPAFGYELATLTVTNSDGTSITVSGTGDNRTFTMPAKNVTVTAAFTASGAYKKTGTTTIKGVEYDLVTFGLWPQTIKAANVEVSEECESKTVGAFTYYKGSDGQWYAKIKENGLITDTYSAKYSDGTTVAQSSDDSYKWFKMEPIKWRVLTMDYNGTGKKLLLAEDILTTCAYYDSIQAYRAIGGNQVYDNNWEHSKIRAFLNGLSYQKRDSNSVAQAACDDFLGKGFLQTAFTSENFAIIQDTSVDNSARSALPDNYDSLTDSEKRMFDVGKYASDTPTIDKVFLLSEREATKSDYGFEVYDANIYADHYARNRIRVPTDYARASGSLVRSSRLYHIYGDYWWLRSPFTDAKCVWNVSHNNDADPRERMSTSIVKGNSGVVPALCVSN